jgi:hypothetical protein
LALLSPYTYEDTRSYRVPAGMAVTAGVSFFSPDISERRDSIWQTKNETHKENISGPKGHILLMR